MPGIVHPVADESEALLAYLAQQRYVLRLTAYGLNEQQARATPTPSPLSVGGLVKHVSAVERFWMDVVLQQVKAPDSDSEQQYQDNFRLSPSETLEGVLADYTEAARETEQIVGTIADIAHAVPVAAGVPWFPKDVEAWSLRWVLLHLIEETARHAGHADIIREAIDGATAFPLIAAAENWPTTPWLKPWVPKT